MKQLSKSKKSPKQKINFLLIFLSLTISFCLGNILSVFKIKKLNLEIIKLNRIKLDNLKIEENEFMAFLEDLEIKVSPSKKDNGYDFIVDAYLLQASSAKQYRYKIFKSLGGENYRLEIISTMFPLDKNGPHLIFKHFIGLDKTSFQSKGSYIYFLEFDDGKVLRKSFQID